MSAVLLIASDAPLKDLEGDDIQIYICGPVFELHTKKKYCACLEWEASNSGGAGEIIRYIREQLQRTDEVELWSVWLDGDFDHRVRKARIPADELTSEDLEELARLEVWREPVTDYVYLVTRSGG